MNLIECATNFARFLKELGINDPYIILILVAMFILGTIMGLNNWYTMNTIKASNKDTIKAHNQTIAFLGEQNKIEADRHQKCEAGQEKLQGEVRELYSKIMTKFFSGEEQ